MDIIERLENRALELRGDLVQEGISAGMSEPLVRFFLNGEQVECLEESDLSSSWDIAVEDNIDVLELVGFAHEAGHLSETPFRRAMLEALAGPGGSWKELVERAKAADPREPAQAFWGVLVSHRDGNVSISECWSSGNEGMETRLMEAMPLAVFLDSLQNDAGPKA